LTRANTSRNTVQSGKEERIGALDTLSQAFGGRCEIWHANLLADKEQVSAKKFLRSQYGGFLNGGQGGPFSRSAAEAKRVSDYIDSVSDAGECFSLIYYEVQKLTQRREPISHRVVLEAPPQKKWEDRISLHRKIVEHTASRNSIAASALFLNESATLPLGERGAKSVVPHNLKAEDGATRWGASALFPADRWFKRFVATEGSSGIFDIVLVESAAWYNVETEGINLPEECKIWASKAFDTHDARQHILRSFQENTLCLQGSQVGPFLHPKFTGLLPSNTWRGAIQTCLDDAFAVGDLPQDDIIHYRTTPFPACYEPSKPEIQLKPRMKPKLEFTWLDRFLSAFLI
jgi:hypothetical protein